MTSATANQPVKPWTRVQWSVLIVMTVVSLALAWQTRTDVLGGDEATYVTLSRSLESGHYRDEFIVGTPRHAQYPPMMPAWLLLVRTVAGPGLEAAIVANLLVFIVGAMFVADTLRRLGMAATGIGAAAAIMVNPALLALAGTHRSETLFITLMSGSLWATVAARRSDGNPRMALALVLACAAFFTRSAGLSVVGGVSWTAARSKRRYAIGAIALLVVVTLLWFGYTQSASKLTVGNSYASDMSRIDRSPMGIITHAANMAREYGLRAPFFQFGAVNVPGTRLDTVVFAALLAGSVLAGLPAMLSLWPAAAVNLALSAALLLAWPWNEARFVAPMLPGVIVALMLGCNRVGSWLGSRQRERAGLIAAAILCAFGLMTQRRAVSIARDCRSQPSYTDPRCYSDEKRHFTIPAQFIRDSIPAGAVIATRKGPTVAVIAERLTLPLWRVPPDAGELPHPLQRDRTYLLLTGHTGDEHRAAADLLAHCRQWSVRASFPLGALLLAPRDAAAGGRPDACVALTHYGEQYPLNPPQ